MCTLLRWEPTQTSKVFLNVTKDAEGSVLRILQADLIRSGERNGEGGSLPIVFLPSSPRQALMEPLGAQPC